MSKRIVNRTLYAAVAAVLYAHATQAQQPSTAEKTTELETVVVTGSLIKGTPEDAALPVEVFTAEDLQKQGDPTPLEFVKELTISGPTTGEAYYFGGSTNTNNVQFNLRGIGADKTLTLFNGRRAFQNVAVYPGIVIERTEILKDGAAVTYGADATGGVVNLITKTNFEGFEAASSYKHYKGTEDGEWKLGGLAGLSTDFANIIVALEWDHRSELGSQERRFSSLPYAVNPAPSSQLTNLAAWLPRGALPNPPTIIDPPAPGTTQNGQGEWGPPVAGLQYDFTQSSCEQVGGIYVPATTASPFHKCAYNYIGYYNLVEENDVYRAYAQLTSKVADTADFTLRVLYARNYSPHQYGSPSQPVIRGPAMITGATYQLYVPNNNPYVADFRARSGFAGAAAGFTPVTYRAFAHGGNPTFASGDNYSVPNENETKYWHVTAGVAGDLADLISYDVGATFNQFVSTNTAPDMLGFRLQNALNGYGGPNCNVRDEDPVRLGIQSSSVAPGTQGCLWWNPFASNFARQPTMNLSNPSYVPGAQNPDELVRWVFNERKSETSSWNVTFDAVFSGDTPLTLPGGALAWGAGAQWRTTKNRESVPDPLYNGMTPCDWPDQDPQPYRLPNGTLNPQFTGCTLDKAGPFLFFGNNPPDATEQTQQSYFVEFNLPVLDSLNFTAAGRYEKFMPIDLDATVYKVSAKWQIIDSLALRGSYGTNYQAPGANIIPGELVNGVNSYTRAGGAWLGAQTYTRTDIKPETATVWNVGLISQFSWGTDQELQVILDYFSIETEDELGLLATANDIADSVFSIPGGTPTAPRLANCSHPLIGRVTFNGGACIQGTTNAQGFSSIRTDFGNGPGQTTAGFDLQLSYALGAGPGRLRFGATVTKVQKFEFTPTILDGFVLKPTDNRLGTLNFATIGQAAPEWRGNLSVNYSISDHNVRLVGNYISGVNDERFLNPDGSLNTAASGLRPEGVQRGTATPFDISTYGIFGEDWKSVDLHYLWNAPWVTVGVSVLNVTDEDPPASRQEFGYDPRIGNPLGRQFEVSLRKKF